MPIPHLHPPISSSSSQQVIFPYSIHMHHLRVCNQKQGQAQLHLITPSTTRILHSSMCCTAGLAWAVQYFS